MNLLKLGFVHKTLKRNYKKMLKYITKIQDFCIEMPCKECVFRDSKSKECFVADMKTTATQIKKVCDNLDKILDK